MDNYESGAVADVPTQAVPTATSQIDRFFSGKKMNLGHRTLRAEHLPAELYAHAFKSVAEEAIPQGADITVARDQACTSLDLILVHNDRRVKLSATAGPKGGYYAGVSILNTLNGQYIQQGTIDHHNPKGMKGDAKILRQDLREYLGLRQ